MEFGEKIGEGGVEFRRFCEKGEGHGGFPEEFGVTASAEICLGCCGGSLEKVDTLTPIEADACLDYLENYLGSTFHLVSVGSRRRGALRLTFLDVLLVHLREEEDNGSDGATIPVSQADANIWETGEVTGIVFDDVGAVEAGKVLEKALKRLFEKSHKDIGPLLDVLRVSTRRALASLMFGTTRVMIDVKAVLRHEVAPAMLHFTGPPDFVGRLRRLATRTSHLILPWAVLKRRYKRVVDVSVRSGGSVKRKKRRTEKEHGVNESDGDLRSSISGSGNSSDDSMDVYNQITATYSGDEYGLMQQ
ncbi:hypothetical protein BC829DRAFT_90450 [Chytridium lagenaria]|nr:hypothetical protein BC829DRAFT_90450 [Chytridium lagenaria]